MSIQDGMFYPRENCHTVVCVSVCVFVHPGDQMQAISLGSKDLYPLSPFPGPEQRFVEHLKQFGPKLRDPITFLLQLLATQTACTPHNCYCKGCFILSSSLPASHSFSHPVCLLFLSLSPSLLVPLPLHCVALASLENSLDQPWD